MDEFDRILIPLDDSEHAQLAVRRGLALAKTLGRPVVGLYVLDARAIDPYPRQTLVVDLRAILQKEAKKTLEAFEKDAADAGIPVEGRILEGVPEEEIVRVARPNDLIVIATHGRRGLSRLLLGSVTESVVRHAPCAVLVLRFAQE